MYDEPDENPTENARDPALRAKEKADELRLHAEIFAVFEGRRKFEAALEFNLDDALARDVQRRVALLEKAKTADNPMLPRKAAADAAELLELVRSSGLSSNDYHVRRRPGEVMIVRWLEGDQVESFYERFQTHFDFALEGHKEDERQAHEWKQDADATAYVAALDKVKINLAERYLREPIRQHGIAVLSTLTTEAMDILHLADYVMETPAADLVGEASAPPSDDPTDEERTWFFKLFSLRGSRDKTEWMVFFTYLQKSDEAW
jgi:hypothetical protein